MNTKQTVLWTALITPFNPDESVDEEALVGLVKMQEEAGNGILLAGSTGEGLALTRDEKKQIVEIVCGLKPDVPVMAGVGGFNLKEQIEWMNECGSLGVDALLLVTPLYSRPGIEGQTDWFMRLMDKAGKPCMIYNIPSRTGVKMPVQVLRNIQHHENFWAVKEASGSIAEYMDFRESCPEVPLYSGDDVLLPFFSAVGCSGLVSVASNVWPEETQHYTKRCISGDMEGLFPVWRKAAGALFTAPNPIPVKMLMKEKGMINHSTLRAPLTEKELAGISHLTDADSQVRNWYKKNVE